LLRFLIIEDDDGMRTIFRTLLRKKFDCEVIEAENGQIGLDLMKRSTPDFIIMDVSMPVMDGFETLKHIRSNIMLKDIPVMIVTAHNDKKTVGNMMEKGVTDYIVKPLDVKVAESRIEKFIMKKEESKGHDTNLSNKAAVSIIAEQILLVDTDAEFISFFTAMLRDRFVIHNASNGVDGLNIFSQYNPHYIFVGNKLSLLDKKILTQKIKDIAPDKKFLVYLLIDDIKELSTKFFTYDGIIKKSLVPDQFIAEFDEKLSVIKAG
jgi:two-component system, cell cycle response regulator